MGNRFAGGGGGKAAQYASLAIQLYGLKQQADSNQLREKEQAMRQDFGSEDRAEVKRINAIKYGVEGQAGTEQRKGDVSERQMQLDEAKQPPSQQPFPSDIAVKQIADLSKDGGNKYNKEMITFVAELMKIEGLTKGEAFVRTRANYKYLSNKSMENLQKEFNKGVAENPGFAESAQGQNILGEIEAINSDPNGDVVNSMFPMVVEEKEIKKEMLEIEQQKAQAALANAQKGERLYPTTEGYKTREEAIGLFKPEKGMEITTADGTTIRTNVSQDQSGLQKKTVTDIEKDIYNSAKRFGRVSTIKQSFQKKFQEIPTRIGVKWSAIKDKLGKNLNPNEKTQLQEFSVFKQDAIENLNLYIKEITGAQMSEKEAERLTKGMPNPGTGVFDGDSPTQFKAKMDNTLKKLRQATARFAYWKRNGFDKSIDTLPVSAMPSIMQEWAENKEQELVNSGMSQQEAQASVMQELPKHFGLTVE